MQSDFDFLNPDYDSIYKLRADRLTLIRNTPGMLEGLKEHYKNNPADFIDDWGMTYDPRQAEVGLPTNMPFMLFPKQRAYIEWLHDRWLKREDGLTEKSRDMGVSWLCVAFGVWMWTFYPGTVIGFGSRKEEYVDKLGDPKSLFWKVRQYINFLPIEFRPEGYVESKHALNMRILNPENESAIVGESGDNIGRGNRTSIYFKDESAFYERPDAIDAALSQTSNCKIDVSTPNGNGNPFYRKRHSGKVKVFTFNWQDDPRKDNAWYEAQKDKLDAVILAQEVDIDYNASTEDSWIPGDIVADAQKNGPADVEAIGGWIVGVDAAHMGNDESVIHKRKGRLNLKQVTRNGLDGVQLAGVVIEECESLDEMPIAIIIELDGPGVSCYDQLKQHVKYGAITYGVHTGARLSDNKNYNVKARMWRNAKTYLNEPPVSLDNDGELKSQLASYKYMYKDGQLLMQSKKEYKKLYGKSPDRADAFVLTHAEVQINKPMPTALPKTVSKFSR